MTLLARVTGLHCIVVGSVARETAVLYVASRKGRFVLVEEALVVSGVAVRFRQHSLDAPPLVPQSMGVIRTSGLQCADLHIGCHCMRTRTL